MSRFLPGAMLRCYYTSPKLADKYINRLKQRAEVSRSTFERKKGRAMSLADLDPAAILRLSSQSSSSLIKGLESPHLSLKATHRMAYALYNLVDRISVEIFERLSLQKQVSIIDMELANGLSEITFTWRPVSRAELQSSEVNSLLTTFASALSDELISRSACSLPPKITFKAFAAEERNSEKFAKILAHCDTVSDPSAANNSSWLPETTVDSSCNGDSLRESINRDFGAMNWHETDNSQPHTIFLQSKKNGATGKPDVYGLNRDALMAKVTRKS